MHLQLPLNGSVKNLGTIFNKCINIYEHVTSLCRAANYHLKNLHFLKTFLTQGTLITVVHAFVASRIDYCNSLLYGISDYNINLQQRIQNSRTRVLINLSIIWHLHICVKYCPLESSHKFRSSSQILLQIPISWLMSYGDCAFSVAVATLWKRLPAVIRNV